ncbi:MAG: family ATPase [Betaproteobacteria bacterium]|nr:family ATPase [Betaproteobacteria bacterium]
MAIPEDMQLQFAWLDSLLGREIERLRTRYQLSLDEFRGLYVSDAQVDEWIAGERGVAAAQTDSDVGYPHPDFTSRAWKELASEFGLATVDQHLLLLGSAVEFDLRYETVFAYLNNDVTRKWPTFDMAERLFAHVHGAVSVLEALSPHGPLFRELLLERTAPPTGHAALLNGGFFVSTPVAQYLKGVAADDARLAGVARITRPALRWQDLPLSDQRQHELSKLPALYADGCKSNVLIFSGSGGAGRSATAEALALALRLPLCTFDLALALRDDNFSDLLALLALQLRLRPAVLHIVGFDGLPAEAHGAPKTCDLSCALAEVGSPIVLSVAPGASGRPWMRGRRALEFRFVLDDFSQATAVWQKLLARRQIDLPVADAQLLANRFALSPGQIDDAIASARDIKLLNGEQDGIDAAALASAVRMGADQSLERLATKIESRYARSDLVLPANTMQRLDEMTAAIRFRHVVYNDWGFAARVSTGTGVKALFAGPSGTGKTMAAGLIARDLGLDMYKIDLSGIVSKYIGETEKNLDRIFYAARTSNAIVFLDEAEAIMGKRSEVKDAHDRYANIEVAYLLQKLEEHDGIVILATNLRRNIDDAFNRRVHYVIDFPPPDEEQRMHLWRGMFPARAPLAEDVDFTFLAKQFDLAGGDIRNVALDAAFLAAQGSNVIDMRCVIEALARQMAKQGKTPTAADFRQYQGLVGEPPRKRSRTISAIK